MGLSPLGSTPGLGRISEPGSRDFATISVTLEKALHVFVTQLIHPSKGAGNNDLTGFLCTLNEKLSDTLKHLHVSGLSSSF